MPADGLAPPEIVRCNVDSDGVAMLVWDDPRRTLNLLDARAIASFGRAVARVLADERAVGAVLLSGKPDWIAGADLGTVRAANVAEATSNADTLSALLRRIETGGKPFIAALGGSALGAGYEVALAMHRRIAASQARARFGCPQVALGLMPAAGGTQRLPRMLGIAAALPLLLEGPTFACDAALAHELIDDIVPAAELVNSAKAWILTRPPAVKPWDEKGYRFPFGSPRDPNIADFLTASAALLRKKTWGNYPATRAILAAVYEGAHVPFDAALRIEGRRFRTLLSAPETRLMVETLFYSMRRAAGPRDPSASSAEPRPRTVAVLGAGMMGAAIAHVTAASGARVLLVDRDLETAVRGKAHAERLLRDRVHQRRMPEAEALRVLARIEPATDYTLLARADIAIEAVDEDRAVKAAVTARAEAALPAHAIVGTNTSTLRIGSLAKASVRPERFIGIHFFSPVEKMRLVEVIRAETTSDETLAIALDYVRSLEKTPIVVKDARGFFTSRVFAAYVNEGIALLQEGVNPASIENGARMAGMAVGPLAVADEVNFGLMLQVISQTRADLGAGYEPSIADTTIERFAGELCRPGKRQGGGVYEYPSTGKKHLWPGLARVFPRAQRQPALALVQERLLTVQTVEALRALDEGVIDDAAMGDVASILGWGFAPFTGGVFSYVEYAGGPAAFQARCAEFARRFGVRFDRARARSRAPADLEGYGDIGPSTGRIARDEVQHVRTNQERR